jgi:NADH-quinone oxidoreductase subunit J
MSAAQITFLILAGVAALAAVGVVAFGNSVRSALSLVVNFFVLAFIYFSLNAQMLGISQILVYAGAIMVLFLFVIMLLSLSASKDVIEKNDRKRVLGPIVGVALAGLVLAQVIVPLRNLNPSPADPLYGTPQAIGMTLFSSYVYPFEIASVLLLVGIVGSILLAKRRI